MWRAFAATVRTGAASQCALQDGRAALEIALAAAQSASTGEPVRIAPPVGTARSVA
jgi:predicted dehydrogenase